MPIKPRSDGFRQMLTRPAASNKLSDILSEGILIEYTAPEQRFYAQLHRNKFHFSPIRILCAHLCYTHFVTRASGPVAFGALSADPFSIDYRT